MRPTQLRLIFIFVFFSQIVFAQTTEPMYAIRKDKQWKFYDNNNKLLFPVKDDIGPLMVHAYYHGWCKVQQLRKDGEEIFFQDGVIDKKGNFIEMPNFSEGFLIAGVDLVEGHKILFWSNWERRFFMSPDGKAVPDYPSENVEGLGGRLVSDQKTENSYNIWDVLEAKLLFEIEAEALGLFANNVLPVKKDGLWGVVDLEGKWLLEPEYKDLGAFNLENEYAYTPDRAFQNKLLVATKDSLKWGLVNAKGKWKVQPQFAEVLYIGQEHWLGKTKNGWKLINPKGEIIKKMLLEESPEAALIDELIVGSAEIYNLKGKLIHKGAEAYQILGEGFFVAKIEEHLHLYKGKNLIKKLPKEIELLKLSAFSNGLSTVKVFKEGGIGYLGFLNQKGEWAIKPNLVARYSALPQAMKTHIHIWDGKKHQFYKHDGSLITEILNDGIWEMFMQLQDGNKGFWAPM